MSGGLTVLVAARDEQERIHETVTRLRADFPLAEIVVADDGSRDDTARRAAAAGARVVRCPRLGKGQALSEGERASRPGRLLLCDADVRGDLRPLLETDGDIAIAVFRRPSGGGFGVAKGAARRLVRLLGGIEATEPLSGQRALSPRARAAVFPVAAGFGAETRMLVDAGRARLPIREVELDLGHRATGRDVMGFAHRGRQLLHLLLACAPQGVNFRGNRAALVGITVGLVCPRVAPVALIGLADDLLGGPARGFRAHLRAGLTTGTLKLVGIPAYVLLRTRSPSAAVLIGLAANALNQLDTRPGRALKAYALGALALGGGSRRALGLAVLLAPYDLREMTMLGDAGANALGAMLGWRSVECYTGWRRLGAISALATLTALGERRSLGGLIESTPGLRHLDAWGRMA